MEWKELICSLGLFALLYVTICGVMVLWKM